MQENNDKPKGLLLMRADFPDNQISSLPKGTKKQNECPAEEKQNCKICGGWHHPKVRHLDYVGHAAVTDRLLDADIGWSWEPLAFGDDGLPRFDANGGLWIKLTVASVTRLGYGNAATKAQMDIGSREKEVIGDALRNAAMRFGAALEMWHKGELHVPEEPEQSPSHTQPRPISAVSAQSQSDDEPPTQEEMRRDMAAATGIDDGVPIVPGAIKIVAMKLAAAGKSEKDLAAKFGVDEVKDLKQNQVNAVLDWLKAKNG